MVPQGYSTDDIPPGDSAVSRQIEWYIGERKSGNTTMSEDKHKVGTASENKKTKAKAEMDGLRQPRHESYPDHRIWSPWQNWLEQNCVCRSDPTIKWERLEEKRKESKKIISRSFVWPVSLCWRRADWVREYRPSRCRHIVCPTSPQSPRLPCQTLQSQDTIIRLTGRKVSTGSSLLSVNVQSMG